MSRAKRKLVSSCLGIIYLAPGISNDVGAKLSRWHLRINFFGANWDYLSSRVFRDSKKFDSKGKKNESNEAMSWLPGKAKGGTESFNNIGTLVLFSTSSAQKKK